MKHCKPLIYVMYAYAVQSHVALFNNTCDLLFANNLHKPAMKSRITSRLVPRMAQAAQERLYVCVTNRPLFRLKRGHSGVYERK